MIEPRILTTLIKLLQAGNQLSCKEASNTVHSSERYMQQIFRKLRAEGKVYISDWGKHGKSQMTATYAWGNKPDKKRPPVESPAERSKRLRKNEEFREMINFNRRAKRSLERHVTLGIWGL